MKRPWINALVAGGVMALLAVAPTGCARGGSASQRQDGGTVVLMDSGPGPGVDAGPRPPMLDGGPPTDFDAGGGFDAGGSSCSETPCRLVSPQCGCAAGEGCYLSGASRVCGAAGPGSEGQACDGTSGCQAGNLCLGTGSAAFCARFCNSDAECPGAGSLCLLQVDDGTGAAVPGVTLCSGSCSPATGSGCPSTMGCAIYVEPMGAMRTFTGCRPAGTVREGSTCTDTEDCVPGTFCAGPTGGPMQCYRWCRQPSGTECIWPTTCTSFTERALVGSDEYGYCQ